MELTIALDEEISELPWDQVFAANQPDTHPTDGRGRRRLPEQWTRVISVHHDNLSAIEIVPLAGDLQLANAF